MAKAKRYDEKKNKEKEKNKSKNKDKSKFSITFLLIVCIILFVISLYKIIEWKMNNDKNRNILEELEDSVIVNLIDGEEKTKDNIDFKTLKEKNPDTVGWLKVNGTNVDYPVVQANDNSYYVNYNFNKEYNGAGWIFADYKNKLDGTDKNIVIYGHNMRDNSMFGSLHNILNDDWYQNEENHIIDLLTENENIQYQVFSVYIIKNEDYYITTNFTDNEFEKYIKTIKSRTIRDFDVDVTTKDSVLTLSTCADNNKYRVVLHAKKIM